MPLIRRTNILRQFLTIEYAIEGTMQWIWPLSCPKGDHPRGKTGTGIYPHEESIDGTSSYLLHVVPYVLLGQDHHPHAAGKLALAGAPDERDFGTLNECSQEAQKKSGRRF
jgi:hypothetical protein